MITKTLLIGGVALFLQAAAHADKTEDDLARQIIESNAGRITIAGLSGRIVLPNGKLGESHGPLESGAILRGRMLSGDVDDAMRIAYAMELLAIWQRNRNAVLAGKEPVDWFDKRLVSAPTHEYMRMEPTDVRERLRVLYGKAVEQDGAGQPATAPESKSEGGQKLDSDSEARPR